MIFTIYINLKYRPVHQIVVVRKHSNTKHKYKQSKSRKETNSDQFRQVICITFYQLIIIVII